jgi:23S rRNA U2552 (ribose-2'-O)-methylase RlmE/FtsJ
LQHDALKLMMNGNHIRPLRSPRTILDLGTKSGVWAAEIANEFDTADEVVGVDIVPVLPFNNPPNCRFEVRQSYHC